ncbi:MAG: hypothetical protein JNK74_15235 [Candidatus Hydrogenedentes bacterium]|nr:hypothetical protein [Candidatus Hydrogenedentota bacterium]
MKSNGEIFRYFTLVACATGSFVLAGVSKVAAGETDQYLTWGTTLRDSSAELNAYLDAEINRFLVKANRRTRPPACVEDLSVDLYLHLFEGLHASRIRNWLKTSPEVERFPSDDLSDWEYQRMSIFRRPAFPYLLPMAQTIRVGDVYLGIDKIGHMFGFGRRYFQIYQRALAAGDSPDAALDRVLRWGIQHESNLVGKLVDGIFSHGDMEANYQGFRLALAFSAGDGPLFYREKGAWRYRGGLDIRDYITPEMDESYNPNRYASWRGRRVNPILDACYKNAAPPSRFRTYQKNHQPSLSKSFVDAWFGQRADASRDALARRDSR